MPMTAYRTVSERATQTETCYEIQKSKFITHLCHVETEDEARAFLLAMKKRYFDARHNCSAYILGRNADKMKSNDDGEPGGTAGNPILEAIKQKGLTDVIVVVTRYFGGIKLGAGGLIRAYSHAATLGLNDAPQIEMRPFCRYGVTIDYALLANVEHWIRQEAIRTEEADYAERVTLHLLVGPDDLPSSMRSKARRLTSRSPVKNHIDRCSFFLYSIPIKQICYQYINFWRLSYARFFP